MTDNDFNPVVEIQAEVQVTPTLELQAEVDMGSLASERNAEAWAVGQRGGVDVSSTDQTYHNNAKYWAEQAEQTVVGSIIDDTSTALNKTWSAHKISEEFDGVDEDVAALGGEVTDLKSAKAPIITETISTPAAVQSFTDGADGMPMGVEVEIAPMQDLHGYDSPWPAGGGKNLLNNTAETTESNGVTFTVNSDGTVSTSGTATGTAVLKIFQTFSENVDLIVNGCPPGGSYDSSYSMLVAKQNGSGVQASSTDIGNGVTILAENVPNIAQIQIIIRSGTNSNGLVFKPMVRLASVSDGTYAPYSNICPITGHTGANVNVANGDDPTATGYEKTTYAITFPTPPGTVYGGTLTVNKDGTGELVVTDANIASYDGETLPGAWISDRDAYESGATPTTGAQVVYKLATPVSYTLTCPQVLSLLGTNNLWADTGKINAVDYPADTKLYIAKVIAELGS